MQAQHRVSGELAALKQVDIVDEEELEDYSIEIDILSDCAHHNVIEMREAFYYNSKLWVSTMVLPSNIGGRL